MNAAAALLFAAVAVLPLRAAADACAGVDRGLNDEDRAGLGAVVARQLQLRGVKLLQALRSESWLVLHIAARDADNSYVFFAGDPHSERYRDAIGEFALPEGEAAIRRWLQENLNGMPPPLVACVAALAAKAQ